jgi:hypothetical protein
MEQTHQKEASRSSTKVTTSPRDPSQSTRFLQSIENATLRISMRTYRQPPMRSEHRYPARTSTLHQHKKSSIHVERANAPNPADRNTRPPAQLSRTNNTPPPKPIQHFQSPSRTLPNPSSNQHPLFSPLRTAYKERNPTSLSFTKPQLPPSTHKNLPPSPAKRKARIGNSLRRLPLNNNNPHQAVSLRAKLCTPANEKGWRCRLFAEIPTQAPLDAVEMAARSASKAYFPLVKD